MHRPEPNGTHIYSRHHVYSGKQILFPRGNEDIQVRKVYCRVCSIPVLTMPRSGLGLGRPLLLLARTTLYLRGNAIRNMVLENITVLRACRGAIRRRCRSAVLSRGATNQMS